MKNGESEDIFINDEWIRSRIHLLGSFNTWIKVVQIKENVSKIFKRKSLAF